MKTFSGPYKAGKLYDTKVHRSFLLLLAILAPFRAGAAEVHVSAAASLTNALKEIAANYGRHNADRIVFNFGSSGMLARQIEEDAPADLFLSADEARMDSLQRKKLIDAKTRVSILSNTLVVIGTASLEKAERIAIGDPATVPAGTYAREYLQKIGIWDRVQSKLIPMENVRAVLAAVESGNADAGIVYRTDAMTSKNVRIQQVIVNGPHISYPFAVSANAQSRDGARRFLAYLTSRPAAAVFRRYGFIVH